jgi:NADPH:quinone reductase-like Zn-dependent oxidoreductase
MSGYQKTNAMKAIIYQEYGTPEVLQLVEIKKPTPSKDEVLVRIKATSVTNADCYMRRADTLFSRIVLGLFKPKERYQILGTEFSGVIEAVGCEVKAWTTGDEIYGFRGFGTGCYAEYKCISSNGSIARKPTTICFEEAASFVDGATTAFFFLKEKARIVSGLKVLVNGASGSIGTFAVQLAKYFGAEVTGVCSSRNFELVKSLGADNVIDYTQDDFTQLNESYDLIFDTVSKSSFKKCRKILSKNGAYINTMFSFSNVIQTILTGLFCSKKMIFAMSVNKTGALNLIRPLIENGKLKTIIDGYYDLEQMAEAHRYVETGHKTGNIVIRV